jgi:hypothetical protein
MFPADPYWPGAGEELPGVWKGAIMSDSLEKLSDEHLQKMTDENRRIFLAIEVVDPMKLHARMAREIIDLRARVKDLCHQVNRTGQYAPKRPA